MGLATYVAAMLAIEHITHHPPEALLGIPAVVLLLVPTVGGGALVGAAALRR